MTRGRALNALKKRAWIACFTGGIITYRVCIIAA